MAELALDLTLIWAGIIGLAVFMYVLMDGFDLGVGILFPFAPSDQDRDLMMNSVAPIWDGNETWLVLGGAGLFAAFPLAYAVILPGIYLPLLIMLIAPDLPRRRLRVPLQGAAAAATCGTAPSTSARWSRPSRRALVLGAFIQGFEVEGRDFAGGMFDWLTPVRAAGGVGAGRRLRAAGLHLADLADRGRAAGLGLPPRASRCCSPCSAFIGVVSIWTPLIDPAIAARWFAWPNIAVSVAGAGGHRAGRLRALARGQPAARCQPFL